MNRESDSDDLSPISGSWDPKSEQEVQLNSQPTHLEAHQPAEEHTASNHIADHIESSDEEEDSSYEQEPEPDETTEAMSDKSEESKADGLEEDNEEDDDYDEEGDGSTHTDADTKPSTTHPPKTPPPQVHLQMKTSPSEKENNNQSSSPSSQNITEIPAIPIIRLTTPNDRKRKRTPQSIPRSATKRTKRSSDDPDLVQETRRQIFEDFGENVEAALVEEMLDFYDDFPDLIEEYRLVNKIGEGTFSSVYKAVDINHNAYDNEAWDRTGLSHVGSSGRKNQHFVAIKRIYVTSSPSRIHNELNILHRLSGHPNIIPIITARRRNDQVIAILPYFEHDDFRTYYRHMTILQIRQYMRSLLSALAHVHAEKIIHRDVKPSNFLYDPELGTGVLVDFGLAQDEPPALKKDAGKPPVGTKGINLEKAGKGGGKRIGYVVNDPRPSARANRAGTRGFRAPEVLFKVSHQTCSIDVWSAGVILLSLFSGQFPFFQSTDDGEALLEIACMFGKEAMQRVASRFKRTFETNIPDVGEQRSFEDICRKLYPRKAGEVPRAGWDLLRRLMALEPEERIGAKEAMKHEFFEGMG